jgi:putative hydrolase of the HAD superfamily
MKKSKYEAVIFDFFGTLVPIYTVNSHNEMLSVMADKIGIPSDFFIDRWLGTFSERVTGKLPDVYSNIMKICNEFGASPPKEQCDVAVEMRLEYSKNHIYPKKHAISTLSRIKALGFKLGLITDCSSELPSIWQETEFAPYFDVTLFSCMEGIKKPDPSIYKKACTLLNVIPENCLYIGDGGSNELTGAKNVGMKPVLIFDNNEQGNPNSHRVDGEEWGGTVIYSLSEVLGLLCEDA